MQKIKDLIYDKNDLFIALVIICIAGILIFNRVEAIMAYPATLAGNAGSNTQEPVDTPTPPATDTTDQGTPPTEPAKEPTDPVKTPPTAQGNAGVVNHSVYIEPGSSGEKIAEVLLSVKLINSTSEFVNAVDNAGLSSKLKAGTFVIPSNSTLDQTIAILTK